MVTWNEATPDGADYISGGDDAIRDLKIATRERFAREHAMLGSGDDADDGKHRFASGLDANKPAAKAGHIYIAVDTYYVYISPADGVWVPYGDPPGIIKMTGAAYPPAGWLVCDGNWISRTTYAALFNAIGTTYGAADGLLYFALPDFKGRGPLGLDSSQTEFNALGKTGGNKTHTLAEAEMYPHAHTATVTDPGHNHQNYIGDNVVGQSSIYSRGDRDNLDSTAIVANTTGITVANSSVGGGVAHNNLAPYLTVNYIIKY